MAWRIDQETGDLIMDGWDKGIAGDPYTGIQDMRTVNIDTVPGEVSVGFTLTANTTSGATLGIPIDRATSFTNGVATAYLILDATGNIFKSTTLTGTFSSVGATTTNASATDGIAVWKGYVFHFRDGNIDYATINASGTVGSWTNAWQTYTGSLLPFQALVGRDDVLYFTNGQFVGALSENAGSTFDPATSSTYTYNQQALTLPSFDIAVSLEEQALNLLIGGAQDAIYVWDRISPTFNNRIFLAERYIRRMVKANTNVFAFTGNTTGRGRIYLTNGSQADIFAKFPDQISGYQEPYYKVFDAIYHRNKLIFGVEVSQNVDGSVITSPSYEVWAIDCSTKALRSISEPPGGAGVPRVLIADTSNSTQKGFAYLIGWSTGTGGTHGIASCQTGAGIGSAVIKTDRIPVGTFLKKKTFSQVEFKLGTSLASGESIILSYITDVSSGSIATFSSSDSTISNVSPISFQNAQWLQIQASLTGNSATSGCRLREIRLR